MNELNIIDSLISGIVGGGVVGLLAKVVWSQLDRRLETIESKVNSMDGVVRKDDCRQDRSTCSGNLGRSIDEIKDMLKEIRGDLYTINGGRRSGDNHKKGD